MLSNLKKNKVFFHIQYRKLFSLIEVVINDKIYIQNTVSSIRRVPRREPKIKKQLVDTN